MPLSHKLLEEFLYRVEFIDTGNEIVEDIKKIIR